MIFEDADDRSKAAEKSGSSDRGCSSRSSGDRSGQRSTRQTATSVKRGVSGGNDGRDEDPDRPNSSKKSKINEDVELEDDDDEEDDSEEEVEDAVQSSNPGTPVVGPPVIAVAVAALQPAVAAPAAVNLVQGAVANPVQVPAANPVQGAAVHLVQGAAAHPVQGAAAHPVQGAAANPVQGNQGALVEGNKGWLSYKELMSTTYPAKSRNVYLAAYLNFERYLRTSEDFDVNVVPSELSIMNYFHHLRVDKRWVSTTLWSHFSRVNAVMKRTWGVNLTIYPRLLQLLKGYETGHKVKKASVFSPQQVI